MDSNQTHTEGMAQRQRRRWRERQHLARLCDLVADSLLPYLEPEPPGTRRPELLREEERCVLLMLARVNKAIRGWDEEEEVVDDGDASDEIVSCSGEAHSCSLPPDHHFDDGFSCLANITSILVGLHHFCSDYIKHSAGNILMAISNSLMKFEAVWIQFVELVWAAIHTVSAHNHSTIDATNCSGKVSTCCSSAVESISQSTMTSSTSITIFMVVLKLRCVSISRLIMTSLFRVLHTILKFLKLSDSELKDDFICLSIHHIQKLRWHPGNQLIAGKVVSLVKDDRDSFSRDYAQLGFVSGSLLQLVCSLVEQSDMEDTGRRDIFVKLVDVIPRLVTFLQEKQDIPKGLSQYYKHKILMLMMRLKPHMQQNCSHIICLLKLLRDHFQNLLHEPMSRHISKLENCLEGSPFLGEIKDKSTRHLQRQAMYLFLSCCIFLGCSGSDSRQKCSSKKDEFGHEVQGCIDHCNYFGLSEISDWFQRCCLDKILDSKSSTDIVLCFLQLYMEEDDILFIILLQLLDAPLILLAIDNMESKCTSELIGAKLFSIIFDPVHTFHVLLSLLSYDHLVLVDYLISKDVGVHCAQYLLRCLRLVSQCWDAFIDDSVYEAQIQKLTYKRQRTLKNTKLGFSRDKGSNSEKELFLSAKVCLLSLKRTLGDLHQKDLFPYNPKPLLKSLARFEELCEQCCNN
ncbi:uncharacterized protein [Lolium perenne]|uniref:uncharacterized protein isoform X1 n=1 Tax=Lolium perenne TaxID=4522 RepID=UPI0021F5D306|nr:uncharacterized protein LOC127320800 isoform X1 [Lolium perenne]XP_051205825.1 uncharacterized protein LOC127320800 isoform X1 [Lolium perenne]XP_051205826.1 uncharacterized protein LOC127320800 isoform X1 [Lolium perenne]XP_051205827.1 uncharacterized protein LOC127320800 isoform X1 [Lolium perenne]